MATTKRKLASIDDAMGMEPTWTNQHLLSEEEIRSAIGRALSWYNYFYEKKAGKKVLLAYLKKHKFEQSIQKAIAKAPEYAIGSTLVAIVKMRNMGLERSIVGANVDDFFNNRLAELTVIGSAIKDEVEEDTTKSTAPVVSIQQRMIETAANLTDDIEEAIESFCANKYKGDFDAFSMLQKQQVKGGIATVMRKFYIGEAEELEEALEGKCEQLNEGYSHMKKVELKRYAQFMRSIINDFDRWIGNQKATRKPRAVKAKPVGKQVEKMKYAKSNAEYKLQSIQPETIIGAQQLWVFNTKYRTLGVYNAIDRGGFSVKGTTIQNFDEATSVKKKLRKPDEVLQRCLTGGKIVLRKLLDEVNSVPSALNGRINEETILVKVLQ